MSEGLAAEVPVPPGVHPDDAGYLTRTIKRTTEPNHTTVRHQMNVPLAEQLKLLKALVHADAAAEEKAKKILVGAIVCAVLTFVLWVFILGIALLPVTIGLFIWRSRVQKSGDMDDRKLDAALRPLIVLGPDLKAGRPFLVDVDFHAYDQLAPDDERKEGGAGMFSYGVTHRRWQHPWLRMQLPLIDGTLAEVNVLTQAKRKSKPKRKYTKHKERLVELLAVRLKLPQPLDVQQAARLQERLTQGAGGQRVRSVKVGGDKVEVSFATPPAGRQRLRGGWQAQGLETLVDGETIVRAVMRTVKATQAARAS